MPVARQTGWRIRSGLWNGAALSAPTAPTAALAGSGAGNVDNGTHNYKVTFVNAAGETNLGTVSNTITVVGNTTNGKVSLTGIPLGATSTTARRIYRAKAGVLTNWYLLTTISDNTTTTYTDNTADASLGIDGTNLPNTSAGVPVAYAVESIALQSDQDFSTPWEINSWKSDFLELPSVFNAADQSKRAMGGIKFKWVFDYMTIGMLSYWLTNFLPGLSFTTGLQSAYVTVLTYTSTDQPVYIQAQIYTPSKTPQVGGYTDVTFQFEGGVIVT